MTDQMLDWHPYALFLWIILIINLPLTYFHPSYNEGNYWKAYFTGIGQIIGITVLGILFMFSCLFIITL